MEEKPKAWLIETIKEIIIEDISENKLSKEELKDYAVLRFALEDYDILDDEAKKTLDETINKRLENSFESPLCGDSSDKNHTEKNLYSFSKGEMINKLWGNSAKTTLKNLRELLSNLKKVICKFLKFH